MVEPVAADMKSTRFQPVLAPLRLMRPCCRLEALLSQPAAPAAFSLGGPAQHKLWSSEPACNLQPVTGRRCSVAAPHPAGAWRILAGSEDAETKASSTGPPQQLSSARVWPLLLLTAQLAVTSTKHSLAMQQKTPADKERTRPSTLKQALAACLVGVRTSRVMLQRVALEAQIAQCAAKLSHQTALAARRQSSSTASCSPACQPARRRGPKTVHAQARAGPHQHSKCYRSWTAKTAPRAGLWQQGWPR